MISYLDVSIIEIIQAISIFNIIKYIYYSSNGLFGKIREILEFNFVNKFIKSISRSSYGIYLLHIILFRAYILPIFEEMLLTGTQAMISILVVNLFLLIGSWLIIFCLSRIPIVKKFSGYY